MFSEIIGSVTSTDGDWTHFHFNYAQLHGFLLNILNFDKSRLENTVFTKLFVCKF